MVSILKITNYFKHSFLLGRDLWDTTIGNSVIGCGSLIFSFYLQRAVDSRHQRESICFLYFIYFFEHLASFHKEFKKARHTYTKILKC